MIRKGGYLAGCIFFVCFLFFSASLARATASLPEIKSSTHLDSTRWYSNSNPEFSWSLPSEVSGVSYLVTDKATSNPGPKSDGVIASASFFGIGDGIQYLHIKFKENGVWGPITHYQFNIDTKAPESFEIKTVSSEDPQPHIIFETIDSLSGIDYYEVKIADGAWETVASSQATDPYAPRFDKIGAQTVYVKAVDKAGNSTISSLPITITSITGAGTSSPAFQWIQNAFDGFINGLSGYGLPVLFLIGFVGLLVLLFQLLGAGFDKAWHRMHDKKVIRKNEHLADKTFEHLIKDMKDEIKFLNAIGKRRRLGPEEKYLKGKLEQYARALKRGT